MVTMAVVGADEVVTLMNLPITTPYERDLQGAAFCVVLKRSLFRMDSVHVNLQGSGTGFQVM